MHVSEARILANRQNAAKSTGPKTPEGKERSRANGLKHGLTGSGVVMLAEDRGEVAQLTQTLRAELAPKTTTGATLVGRLARFSVRMERSGRQEDAALARNVRHAADDFDEARLDQAERLYDRLGEEPRIHLRKLKKSPEGVDRLVVAWNEIRDDLTRQYRPHWTAWHLETAVNMLGLRIEAAQGTRFKALSAVAWGDDTGVAEAEIRHLIGPDRKAWARNLLVELIDQEIARLQGHRETLDLEMIELDRAEAGGRALFDPSHEATLARRYEAAAHRGFFKTLKELRQIEAEAAAQPLAEVAPIMASCGNNSPTGDDEPVDELEAELLTPEALAWLAPLPPIEPVRCADGQVLLSRKARLGLT